MIMTIYIYIRRREEGRGFGWSFCRGNCKEDGGKESVVGRARM